MDDFITELWFLPGHPLVTLVWFLAGGIAFFFACYFAHLPANTNFPTFSRWAKSAKKILWWWIAITVFWWVVTFLLILFVPIVMMWTGTWNP